MENKEKKLREHYHIWIVTAVFITFFICLAIGTFIFIFAYEQGEEIGYKKGYKLGEDAGYREGYSNGRTVGINSGVNDAIGCLNRCNSGTGIINECYSLSCIRTCFEGVRN